MRYHYSLIVLLAAVACNRDEEAVVSPATDSLPLSGIEASIYNGSVTRAPSLADYVGRSVFVDGDQMVLTSMHRTAQPLREFSYSDLVYNYGDGWSRDESEGSNAAGSLFDKIYWSDAANPHTYIGYSVPQGSFDWVKDGNYYYGSIGNPSDQGDDALIDYRTKKDAEGNITEDGSQKLKDDDVVVTYHTHLQAEVGGSVAVLSFHHALAQVRVIVNITGFSSGPESDDNKAVVSNMMLSKLRTRYKWQNVVSDAELPQKNPWSLEIFNDIGNISAEALAEAGEPYSEQLKDTYFWIPRPEGVGNGASRTFTFYALAVPVELAENTQKFSFAVTYPHPMKPTTETVTYNYSAYIPAAIEFRAGHCTTIHISLNHRNEKMTVGAEYMDWQFIDTPDQGELYKNSTFLESVDPSLVTIIGQKDSQGKYLANEDDATWLYDHKYNGDPLPDGEIRDVYGNLGTAESPYTISTAMQLLSFALEVQNGRDFTGKYIKLDANITMQKKSVANNSNPDAMSDTQLLQWTGIGNSGHPFNGTFLGSNRYVTLLRGKPLFHTLGTNARIESFGVSSTAGKGVDGVGLLAEVNNGQIYSCYATGNIVANNPSAAVGGMVGTNAGTIYGSYHQGTIISATAKGGIAGTNSGTIRGCYSVGGQYDSQTIADADNDTPPVSAIANGGITSSNTGTVTGCYYSNSLVSESGAGASVPGVTGYSSAYMQKEIFVSGVPASGENAAVPGLVDALDSSLGYTFFYVPASYPKTGLTTIPTPTPAPWK